MTNAEFLARYGYLKYVRQDKLVTFMWEGGQYVDVFFSDHQAIWGTDAVAFETINVLDASGVPAVGPDDWRSACDAWLALNEHEIPRHLQQWSGL